MARVLEGRPEECLVLRDEGGVTAVAAGQPVLVLRHEIALATALAFLLEALDRVPIDLVELPDLDVRSRLPLLADLAHLWSLYSHFRAGGRGSRRLGGFLGRGACPGPCLILV